MVNIFDGNWPHLAEPSDANNLSGMHSTSAAARLLKDGDHLDGLRVALAIVLAERGAPLSVMGQTKVGTCDDAETLMRWIARAVTADSEATLFAPAGIAK